MCNHPANGNIRKNVTTKTS